MSEHTAPSTEDVNAPLHTLPGPLRHLATTPRPWGTYVAVGDSFTEGMCDDDSPAAGEFRGWADRLATMLAQSAPVPGPGEPGFRYANLAVRGRKLDDVAGPQTETALGLVQQARHERPDAPVLVSIVGGGNDILRPRADIDVLARGLEQAVVRLRAAGADVLLATPTDPAEAPIIAATRGRVGQYIAHLLSIAGRHGCHLLNQWDLDFLKDWRMWGEDRIHMTPEGHRRVALAAHAALGFPEADEGTFRHPLDAATAPRPTWAEHRRWARTHAGPWVKRRVTGRSSGDGRDGKLPALTPWPPA
ncbi:SGNH/GDSL hydrolase family protein [Kytococcus sp. Marseille-QA3725]